MTLSSIENEIEKHGKSVHFLNEYILNNFATLQLFFLNLSETDCVPIEKDLEDFYYNFVNTPAIITLKNETSEPTEKILGFIILLAKVYENIYAQAIIADIASLLPTKSSIRYRLKALSAYWEGRTNMNTYFGKSFPRVMKWLGKAQDAEGEDYSYEVATAAIKFYQEGKLFYDKKNKKDIANKFKELFLLQKHKDSHKFLNHYLVKRVLEGITFEELKLKSPIRKVYEPSLRMHTFFRNMIVNKVQQHPKSIKGKLLGFDSSEIRYDIIQCGTADFRNKYKSLTTDNIVLLYCYFNMRKHYFSTLHFFNKIDTLFKRISLKEPIVFIDLGCGPLTSGLALGEYFHIKTSQKLSMNYFGIDIAKSMLKKAKDFSEIDLFSNQCSWTFSDNWNGVFNNICNQIIQNKTKIVINASYLFASSSLDENDLAKFINKLNRKFPNNETIFFFQNPVNPTRNSKFFSFKEKLKFLKKSMQFNEIVYYNNYPNSHYEPKKETVYFEILTNH